MQEKKPRKREKMDEMRECFSSLPFSLALQDYCDDNLDQQPYNVFTNESFNKNSEMVKDITELTNSKSNNSNTINWSNSEQPQNNFIDCNQNGEEFFTDIDQENFGYFIFFHLSFYFVWL